MFSKEELILAFNFILEISTARNADEVDLARKNAKKFLDKAKSESPKIYEDAISILEIKLFILNHTLYAVLDEADKHFSDEDWVLYLKILSRASKRLIEAIVSEINQERLTK